MMCLFICTSPLNSKCMNNRCINVYIHGTRHIVQGRKKQHVAHGTNQNLQSYGRMLRGILMCNSKHCYTPNNETRSCSICLKQTRGVLTKNYGMTSAKHGCNCNQFVWKNNWSINLTRHTKHCYFMDGKMLTTSYTYSTIMLKIKTTEEELFIMFVTTHEALPRTFTMQRWSWQGI